MESTIIYSDTIIDALKAINENKKLRSGEKDEEDARKDRKERKSGKSSCGTCCVLKWVFKIFFGWLCLCINLNDD